MLSQRAMKPEFIVLGLIVAGALYLFWTQKLHTDVTAVLVMLSLAVPWPRPDGRWSAILSPQEAFSGFGSVAVIMVTPMFVAVCKERHLSPSRSLLCAAYGAALGGQWTLIGTRSNIIVSDFLRQRTGHGIDFFDFTPIAATVFVGCATYFFLFGRRFLPKAEVQSLEQELGKEYLTEVMVTPQSSTVGLTLDQLDWAKRQDVTIVGVIREGERMPPTGG